MKRLAVLLCVAALHAACQVPARMAMETHLPEQPNPTSWLFDRPLAEVRQAIWNVHSNYALTSGTPVQRGFTQAASVLDSPGNENDFILWQPRHPYGWSDVYRSSEGPLRYRTDIQLHLTELSPNRTQVEVIMLHPEVYAWAWNIEGTHYGQDVWFDVEPTTVEEYQILLSIGEELGLQDMPAIHQPAD